MKKILSILSLLIIFCFQDINAQVKKWTLEDCINYAITNNIGLQRQRLLTESKKTDLLASRAALLPNLNGESDLTITDGRSIDQQNLTTFNRNIQNNINLSTYICLLYTSDAADEEDSVDLGGRRIIK